MPTNCAQQKHLATVWTGLQWHAAAWLHPPFHMLLKIRRRHAHAGTPPISNEPWTRDVEWVRGNVLEPETYRRHLAGAVAAISCVGGFGNQQEMLRVGRGGLCWGAAGVPSLSHSAHPRQGPPQLL